MKKMLVALCVASVTLWSTVSHAAVKRPLLVLSGPPASVSTPLIHMVETGALRDVADKVEFRPWRDPDQLRVMAMGAQADFMAMPTNVAANLYHREVPLRLLNVSTWGILWLVSRDAQAKTLADFRGQEIAMPFRADMPDIVFGVLAAKQGIDIKKDMKLRYVATPLDAMQLLLMRRVEHALLPEPAVSMALRKTRSFPVSVVAPELYRSVDLQREWGRVFQRETRIPQAGIAVLGRALTDKSLQNKVLAAYAQSLKWCQAHALQCGEMVAKRMPMLSAEAVADSLVSSQMNAVPTAQAKPDLQFFFEQLHAIHPALLGGRLPSESFYQ